ncbi:cystine/glutamate transporter-like [Diadema antillarum]|uniref:cystine/glutamate transporter-like n=1 Tax=Diadema antillarum TaxID=105358 RepID=UPI003A87F1C6
MAASSNDVISVSDKPSTKTNSTSQKVVLRKQVSLLDCVALGAGTIVGSGIFVSPKGVLANTGSLGMSLVVWVASGFLSIMGALSYAELGTTFVKSGGDFVFLLDGLSPLLAFLRLWTSIVSVRTGAYTVLSITFAKYALAPFFYGCDNAPFLAERLLAACALCLVFYVNCASVTWSRRVQVVFSVAKFLAILVIVISGLVVLGQGGTTNFEHSFESSQNFEYTKLPLAVYYALFAYAGWQYLPQITEEIVNINRTLPYGLIISILLVSCLYTLTNVAYFAVLSPIEILSSSAVAVDYGRRVLGSFWWVLSISVSISCIGSINGGLFSSSRMLFVASREGHLPKIASMIHIRCYSPLPAAAVMLPICLLMLTSDNVYKLLNFLSFSRWAFIALAVATIPYHRWKHPDAPRPFKIPVVIPIIFSCFALFVVIMSLYSAPVECGIGLAITAAGIPVYLVGVKWQTKPVWLVGMSESVTIFLQKLFLVICQEEKTC